MADSNTPSQQSTDIITPDKVLPTEILIIPIKERPFFPGMPFPLTITGSDLLNAIKIAIEQRNGYIGIVMVSELDENDIRKSHLFEVGTISRIFRVLPINEQSVQLFSQGISRFTKVSNIAHNPHLIWEVEPYQDPEEAPSQEIKAYTMAIANKVKELVSLNTVFQEQLKLIANQLSHEKPGLMMDVISAMLSSINSIRLQELLETFDLQDRAQLLLEYLNEEIQVAQVQQRISKQINEKVNEQQKEFFLREQLKAIKKELGIEKDDQTAEIEKFESRIANLTLTEEAERVMREEMNKLSTLDNRSPEYNVSRSYLDVLTDLPWGIFSEDTMNINKAEEVLNRDHYGLEDVKLLILEFLSTLIKRGRLSGSIICLVGPPGVGKTSIGKSISEALNRKFFRFSLGGMRDEAEIKGHRRTYIGAMPGKFINAVRRSGTSNPVIMLDEIDKIGMSYQGDPASALLEVLDPEQNSTFMDHYLDVPFDLSNVLFIATANQLDTISGPLLDRMEVIRLSGYILEEKVEIAKRYLIPKQLRENGYKEAEITFTDEALTFIIDKFAREAGVRNLEKQIKKILRKLTLKNAKGEEIATLINAENVEAYLGKAVFHTEKLYNKDVPGVALGLAYTSMGGATLYVEATSIEGQKGFKLTGQLGDVMRESAEIAFSHVQNILSKYESYQSYFDDHKIHLHVPAGATPKDGPSAGITIALALYSLVCHQAVKNDLAMTGELTLTGKVLPIGGVREKTIAAKRVGIQHLIFPKDNQADVEDLPDYVKENIHIDYADYFQDVLDIAFSHESA